MSILFFSVIVSFLNACLPKMTKKVSFFVKRPDTSACKEEMQQIVAEMKAISIRHDFPKYARLKRKLNKLTDDKQSADRAYKAEYAELTLKISYICQGIMTILSLVMFWMFRFHPVISLPQEWTYPLETVLSWPIQSPGDISFPVWFLITNSVSKVICGSF